MAVPERNDPTKSTSGRRAAVHGPNWGSSLASAEQSPLEGPGSHEPDVGDTKGGSEPSAPVSRLGAATTGRT